MLGGTPNLLVVARKAVPVSTLQELVAYAKANPSKVNYGTSGVGTLNHLLMEQFKHAAGRARFLRSPIAASGRHSPMPWAGRSR